MDEATADAACEVTATPAAPTADAAVADSRGSIAPVASAPADGRLQDATADRGTPDDDAPVLRVRDIPFAAAEHLLAEHALRLHRVADGAAIPGSFWGEPEAGVIGSDVYVRGDTPVHSLLHEAGHLMVLPPERRAAVHTDATDSVAEEDATCYLQIVLADRLPGVGRARLMTDMDAWGYTFRLGSTQAWFEHDADDARRWLQARGLLPADA